MLGEYSYIISLCSDHRVYESKLKSENKHFKIDLLDIHSRTFLNLSASFCE
jgi:hypothetical protein